MQFQEERPQYCSIRGRVAKENEGPTHLPGFLPCSEKHWSSLRDCVR